MKLIIFNLVIFTICLFAVVTVSGKPPRFDLSLPTEVLFKQFIMAFQKKYSLKESTERADIFAQNVDRVKVYNQREGAPIYGITKFSDLTPEEFAETHLMKNFNPTLKQRNIQEERRKKQRLFQLPSGFTIPTDFDWRTKGAVTDVYDQGMCGSCWAFSATETVESQWFLAGHTIVDLSVQQIVDCDKGRGDEGCNGGDTPTAYQYVMSAGGMDSDQDYPYTGEDDQCAFDPKKEVAHISNWFYATTDKNEIEMQEVLVAKGPLSICVDAATWQFYVGGVVSHWCGEDLDHCVQIVGFQNYTTWDFAVKQIWLVRNSWGADWGEDGYIYIERGGDLCGIADEVTLPVV